MYLLLGSAGQEGGAGCGGQEGDRVSASSGIASGSSSQPWLEDQDLSGSSCECDTSTASRASKRGKRSPRHRRPGPASRATATVTATVTAAQCHRSGIVRLYAAQGQHNSLKQNG